MHWDQNKACIKCGLQKGCSTEYCFYLRLGNSNPYLIKENLSVQL